MDYTPGMQLRSVVDETEIVVVRPPIQPVEIGCGGQPMARRDSDATEPVPADPSRCDGTELGKRYVHAESELEVLVTKAGTGTLHVGDDALPRKESKPLPSSD